ncbi:MAG: hypothetical protein U0527_02795 [Candidatus Eisenbacteria bacterium]
MVDVQPAERREPTADSRLSGLGRGRRRVARGASFAHLWQYLALRVLISVLSRLSWRRTRQLGRALGTFAGKFVRLRRKVTIDNLRRAYPEWDDDRVIATAEESYREIGTTFLELFRHLAPGEAATRVHGLDPRALEAVRAEGRGAVLVTGHIGTWELVGAALGGRGWPVNVVVATQRNARVDALVTRMREAAGLRVLRTDQGLRPMLRVLRANEFLCFLNDQDAGPNGCFVPFLGRPASTALGPARFARLAGCPLVCGYSLRRPDGTYDLEITEPIRLRPDLPLEEAEREVTRRMVEPLEARCGGIRRSGSGCNGSPEDLAVDGRETRLVGGIEDARSELASPSGAPRDSFDEQRVDLLSCLPGAESPAGSGWRAFSNGKRSTRPTAPPRMRFGVVNRRRSQPCASVYRSPIRKHDHRVIGLNYRDHALEQKKNASRWCCLSRRRRAAWPARAIRPGLPVQEPQVDAEKPPRDFRAAPPG